MNKPHDILAALVNLLAEQEGVTITYEVKEANKEKQHGT